MLRPYGLTWFRREVAHSSPPPFLASQAATLDKQLVWIFWRERGMSFFSVFGPGFPLKSHTRLKGSGIDFR